ncbi:MAG: hypothetical protein BWY21_02330 [Parcubacteria group bacterium ADurb.Bin216]|nr:MAG: hypothetical protein BWY21_02330 [Parcubacteria group bacterium ADurb.Bin216]
MGLPSEATSFSIYNEGINLLTFSIVSSLSCVLLLSLFCSSCGYSGLGLKPVSWLVITLSNGTKAYLIFSSLFFLYTFFSFPMFSSGITFVFSGSTLSTISSILPTAGAFLTSTSSFFSPSWGAIFPSPAL